MAEKITLDWQALVNLIPACIEFKEQTARSESPDLHAIAVQAGAALGISDVDQFAVGKVRSALQEGFAGAFDSEGSKELAALFAKNARPVMGLVVKFAQGNLDTSSLVSELNKLCFGNAANIQQVLQESLGVPDQTAEFLARKLGPYLTSVYAFTGAYKIYERAAGDVELARERRIEIERLVDEAIDELKKQRDEMECFVETYMLNKLEPFSNSIYAMNEAILDDDDDQYIAANTELWELFGRSSQYESAEEFDDLMLSDEVFKL